MVVVRVHRFQLFVRILRLCLVSCIDAFRSFCVLSQLRVSFNFPDILFFRSFVVVSVYLVNLSFCLRFSSDCTAVNAICYTTVNNIKVHRTMAWYFPNPVPNPGTFLTP